jgi:hypothetical protein
MSTSSGAQPKTASVCGRTSFVLHLWRAAGARGQGKPATRLPNHMPVEPCERTETPGFRARSHPLFVGRWFRIRSPAPRTTPP